MAPVTNPRVLINISPHFDFQLNPKNSLAVNYRYFEIDERNDGVDTWACRSGLASDFSDVPQTPPAGSEDRLVHD
jgi:hypothetical protein